MDALFFILFFGGCAASPFIYIWFIKGMTLKEYARDKEVRRRSERMEIEYVNGRLDADAYDRFRERYDQ